MNEMRWFRFYNEVFDDEKIIDIAEKENQPYLLVVGFWTLLLSLASKSCDRGYLWVYQDKPYTVAKIARKGKISPEIAQKLIDAFMGSPNMLEKKDLVYHVIHWNERQFKSDNSVERVREHRRKKATA